MTPLTSRLLVIDASVIQSAGETEHPVSSACRDTLLAVLHICHRVALTEAMRDDCKGHMSRFWRKWLRSMAARKKSLKPIRPTELSIDMAGLSEADRDAIEKDRCLLEAALSADRIIVTRDDSLGRAVANTRQTRKNKKIRSIKWINPVSDGPGALERL